MAKKRDSNGTKRTAVADLSEMGPGTRAGTRQVTDEPPHDEARLLSRALATVAKGIGALEESIEAASRAVRESIGEGSYDDKAASHLAWITKGAAQIAGEVRKAEAHDQGQLKKLTPAIVVEWYRQLTEDERADLHRRLTSIDDGRSVLAL